MPLKLCTSCLLRPTVLSCSPTSRHPPSPPHSCASCQPASQPTTCLRACPQWRLRHTSALGCPLHSTPCGLTPIGLHLICSSLFLLSDLLHTGWVHVRSRLPRACSVTVSDVTLRMLMHLHAVLVAMGAAYCTLRSQARACPTLQHARSATGSGSRHACWRPVANQLHLVCVCMCAVWPRCYVVWKVL